MGRSLVFVREAVPADAVRLAELWADLLRRGDEADHVDDLTHVIETAGQDPDQRLVVAEYDGIIHPVAAEFIDEAITRADTSGAAVVVVVLRTPGGLLDSARLRVLAG